MLPSYTLRIDLNRCRSAPAVTTRAVERRPAPLGYKIGVEERAATLLDLIACAAQVKASVDTRDLFFPKVTINPGVAEHRALRDAIHDYARINGLSVIG